MIWPLAPAARVHLSWVLKSARSTLGSVVGGRSDSTSCASSAVRASDTPMLILAEQTHSCAPVLTRRRRRLSTKADVLCRREHDSIPSPLVFFPIVDERLAIMLRSMPPCCCSGKFLEGKIARLPLSTVLYFMAATAVSTVLPPMFHETKATSPHRP